MWIDADNREMRIFTALGVNKYWIKSIQMLTGFSQSSCSSKRGLNSWMVVTVSIQWLEMFAQKSRGVQVRASLCPHMIRSDLSPSSNTCTGDWHFSLLTGHPRNRKHLPELLLDVYWKPQADVFLDVHYPQWCGQQLFHTAPDLISHVISTGFMIFMFLFLSLFFNNSVSRFLVSLSLSIITRLPFVDNLIMLIVKVLASTWRTFSLVQRCSYKWSFCTFPGPSCGPWLPLTVLF